MEETWSGVEEMDIWLDTMWGDPLLEAIQERSYHRVYTLLRRGEYPRDERAVWILLTQAVSAPPRLFGMLLEALEDEIDLTVKRKYMDRERDGISIVCYGTLMHVAAIAGTRENMALLRRRGLDPAASVGSWIELRSTGVRMEEISPLAAAMLSGAEGPLSWLIEQKEVAEPDNETLRCAVLFGLYYGEGRDSCVCARRVLSCWGLDDGKLRGESFPEWVQAQCRIAPVRQLTAWFREDVYDQKVVERYGPLLLSRSKQEENLYFLPKPAVGKMMDVRRLFSSQEDWKGFLLELLRRCPGLCRKTEVMEWLFLFEYSSEELTILSRCLGQRGEPVELGVPALLERLLFQPAPVRKRLLHLLHDTCGVCVTLTGLNFREMFAPLKMLPDLLRYVRIQNGSRPDSCSLLAGLLARYGQAAEFKKAIAAGYLEDEPLGPLLKELREQDAHALIPLALTLLPHRDGLCEL